MTWLDYMDAVMYIDSVENFWHLPPYEERVPIPRNWLEETDDAA